MNVEFSPELEFCLRLWGWQFGEAREAEWDEADEAAPAGVNAIATAVEFGCPKTMLRRNLVLERTTARRLLLGHAAGLITVKGRPLPVPAWAAETVRCKETRTPGAPWTPHPVGERIEKAVLALYAYDRRASITLRAHYCLRRMPRNERVQWVGFKTGTRVSRMGYSAALIRGKLAVAPVAKNIG